MKVNTNENIIHFDVDETLILHDPTKHQSSRKIMLDYYGHSNIFAVHEEHVKLLKAYKARGFYIRVNSNNGYRWAEEVVKALHLTDYVDEVSTKAVKYVDDKKEAEQVVGQHVYIPVS